MECAWVVYICGVFVMNPSDPSFVEEPPSPSLCGSWQDSSLVFHLGSCCSQEGMTQVYDQDLTKWMLLTRTLIWRW